jgi:hypothetical protein
MQCPEAGFLADELKKLVGVGVQPIRLAVLPQLRVFANLPPEVTLQPRRDGLLIRNKLTQAIDSLSGVYEFHGELVPAEKMSRAIRLLLKIEGTGQSAEVRRARAISVLGLAHRYSVSTWRHPDGPEYDLMLLLAESMVPRLCQDSA